METQRKLVVVISHGLDNERSSVAWSIANGGINNGLDVSIFLVSSGIDWVRKGAAERARPNPEDPMMKDMIQKVIDSGCQIGVCPPCAKVRGYESADLVDGVTIVGSVFIHERVKEGAAILSF
ncbi:DsrE family protein [Mangrovibacterium lignilyticum]|uniref:DsrE family protein n=1 Tax=Mangrovibacterium lignilyticum TaxID=2668052 RepID=UPI0013D58E1C|nr:DsrE family protein [Mangrovibacterium lignilyticum]